MGNAKRAFLEARWRQKHEIQSLDETIVVTRKDIYVSTSLIRIKDRRNAVTERVDVGSL